MNRIHSGPLDHFVALGVPLFVIANLSQINGLGVGNHTTVFSAMLTGALVVIARRLSDGLLGQLIKKSSPVTFYAFHGSINALVATASFMLLYR